MNTYTITKDKLSITCHVCGNTSHNLNDIAHTYCATCQAMHRDPQSSYAVVVKLSPTVASLLAVLLNGYTPTVKAVMRALVDHAQQGVYRPGAWEREWLCQALGCGWEDKLEPGDPYGRAGCESIFQRPADFAPEDPAGNA